MAVMGVFIAIELSDVATMTLISLVAYFERSERIKIVSDEYD